MNLKKMVDEFDMILVGIGEYFQENFTEITIESQDNSLLGDLHKKIYLDNHKETKTDDSYKKLFQLLENKNYFVVTLCKDDKIYHSGLKKDRIVAPCGSYSLLQCSQVCTTDIFPLEKYKEEILEKQEAFCPYCGAPLTINKIDTPKYSEEGYLAQWNLYTKWLSETMNRKLLILELGVDMKFPSVIRWPFEKICYINQKAKMLRINNALFHMAEEIKDRGTGIQEDPVDFLLNQIV